MQSLHLVAFLFPMLLAPQAPFPLVVSQSAESQFVAPGVSYAQYVLTTSSGPLVVNAVAIDTNEPTVRFGAVVAADHLISPGETTSSMGRRTGAVAGINADYFDIGNTNEPLGAVVRDGALVRSPGKFAALAITKTRSAIMSVLRFTGTVAYGGASVPLTGVNEWPPQGGASLITPQLGNVPAENGVTRVRLAPLPGAPSRYRVDAVEDASKAGPPMTALGFGPALKGTVPPQPGDTVTIAYATEPPIDTLAAVVSGGPILIKDGAPFDDPLAPAPGERDKPFPVVGAARTGEGTMVFLEVDGRQPAFSIGLTRPEFGALMLAFGARDGIAFDSGGSATLVTRRLGDESVSVRNSPSDGRERNVADALFVYSDAPRGPPARLVVRPDHAWMLAKSSIPLWSAVTDAAGHALRTVQAPLTGSSIPAGVATLSAGGTLTAAATRASGIMHVRGGPLESDLLVDVVPSIDRLTILPAHPNPDPHARMEFQALGYDKGGHTIALGDQVTWHSTSGAIDRNGDFHAGDEDATIEASAGGMRTAVHVPVGRHESALPIFNENNVTPVAWSFSSTPANRPGFARTGEDCAACLAIGYDFTQDERVALASAPIAFAGDPLGISVEILGDGSGTSLRAAFVNGVGERFAVILVPQIDWRGWQRRESHFPPNGIAPVRFIGFSLVPKNNKNAGTIALRSARVLLAGSQTPKPLFTVTP